MMLLEEDIAEIQTFRGGVTNVETIAVLPTGDLNL